MIDPVQGGGAASDRPRPHNILGKGIQLECASACSDPLHVDDPEAELAMIALKVTRQVYFRASLTRTLFNQPKEGNVLYRAGGITSLFRLPIEEAQPKGLDACFVGVPMDIGCSNRSGTRHGPRAIRHESVVIRCISDVGACPFESLQVADIGDVSVVPYSMQRTIDSITEYFLRIMEANCVPLAMGGDHTMTYPILRAIKELSA